MTVPAVSFTLPRWPLKAPIKPEPPQYSYPLMANDQWVRSQPPAVKTVPPSFAGLAKQVLFGASRRWDEQTSGPTTDDEQRYRDISSGRRRKDLLDKVLDGHFDDDEDGDGSIIIDSMPPVIDIPEISWGDPGGEGEGGLDGIMSGYGPGSAHNPQDEPIDPRSGYKDHGEHGKERVKIKDVLRILREDWGLPDLKHRGEGDMIIKEPFRAHSKNPPGRVNIPKTVRDYALPRSAQEAAGRGEEFDPDTLTIRDDDYVFNVVQNRDLPKLRTAIYYVTDASGSMMDKPLKMIKKVNYMASMVIKDLAGQIQADAVGDDYDDTFEKHYGQGVTEKFYYYDAMPHETDEAGFYGVQAGWDNRILPMYRMLADKIRTETPLDSWNVYVFHFSDTDYYPQEDRESAGIVTDLLREGLNMFAFIGVDPAGNGPKYYPKPPYDQFLRQNVDSQYHGRLRTTHFNKDTKEELHKTLDDLFSLTKQQAA